jgi:hypothetical protein
MIPNPLRPIIFARKHAHGSGDGYVDGDVKADSIFPRALADEVIK